MAKCSTMLTDISHSIGSNDIGSASTGSSTGSSSSDKDVNFEHWQQSGLPLPLIAACAACQKGVKRSHLVDAHMDGALLLELYSRDGVGTMFSTDFYEVRHMATIA